MADMKQAKCPNCGATLPVDPKKEATICSYCGSPFITEKAIVNVNNYNTTNNITVNESKKDTIVTVFNSLAKAVIIVALGFFCINACVFSIGISLNTFYTFYNAKEVKGMFTIGILLILVGVLVLLFNEKGGNNKED